MSRKRKREDDDADASGDDLDLEDAISGLEDAMSGLEDAMSGFEDESFGSDARDREVNNDVPVPMSTSGSISEIRAKLHAKIASFRNGRRAEDEAGSKDELLEMRRHRAAIREQRRRKTKEKKEEEKEAKKKKGSGKHASGNTSKVCKALLVYKERPESKFVCEATVTCARYCVTLKSAYGWSLSSLHDDCRLLRAFRCSSESLQEA